MGNNDSSFHYKDTQTLETPKGSKYTWNSDYDYRGSSAKLPKVVDSMGQHYQRQLSVAQKAVSDMDRSALPASPQYKSVIKG